MIHMAIDNDIQLEGMCPKCHTETEQKRCNVCGDRMFDNNEINPSFDEELFNQLKNKK